MRLINLIFVVSFFVGSVFAQGVVIDHTCADLDEIPSVWITAIQNTVQSHYAHTSHGGQLTYGVEFIEDANSFYDCELGYLTLPTTSGAYCVFDGQETTDYVGPEDYWQTEDGLNLTRDVLNNNPTLDTSMWCWCTQCNSYSEAQVQAYLDAMTQLEGEYPEITFVYFTGNAQETGSSGYNRFQRNNQIRDYCSENNKILFDFADLDCWWYNPSTSQWEQNTYSYSGIDVPLEHPQYNGDEYSHTTAESCIVKGKAWWWMMAVLAGWSSTGISMESFDPVLNISISMDNPVTSPFAVSVLNPIESEVSLNVYDITGRHSTQIAEKIFMQGNHTFQVDGLETGVYFIVVDDGLSSFSQKTVVIN